MDLATWLSEHDLTDAAFAGRVGVSQTTISRVRRGVQMPEARLIDRIEAVTDGKVTAADLFASVRAAKRAGDERQHAGMLA